MAISTNTNLEMFKTYMRITGSDEDDLLNLMLHHADETVRERANIDAADAIPDDVIMVVFRIAENLYNREPYSLTMEEIASDGITVKDTTVLRCEAE